jgi:hypothetical protein|tara:strand:- start:167 stop:346 length:180 start_codon:yes stop_codon:yes gene_type:complete
MAKKRKLNSKNPRYQAKTADNSPKIKEKKLLCDIPVRNSNGDIIEGKTIPMYGVWYEND